MKYPKASTLVLLNDYQVWVLLVLAGGRGDIHVRYVVEQHSRFSRNGENLVEQLWIPVTYAALGAEIEYETFDGIQKLKIPAGSRTGDKFRYSGLGVPRLQRRGRGDLIVEILIDTPQISQKYLSV